MDDLEFRRRLYGDPSDDSNDIKDAIAADSKRIKFADELKQFDQRIASALNVDIPENMAEQLILRQSLHSHQLTKRKSRVHLAIAASVAVIVGVAVNFVNFSPVFTSTADYSLAHYHHEADKFTNTAQAQFSLASINEEMNGLQVSFLEKIGKLISIDGCFFDSMDSMHLVFEGEYDNVTVFIIPKSEHLAFSKQFEDADVRGVATQYTNGEVIIIGNKKEALGQWQQKIDDTLEWSI
ncbi:DUF3379 family protein [Colwelliaceae bacterium BS250]